MSRTIEELRLPPQSLDAEKGVLGGILLLNEAIDDVAAIIKPDHFYSDANQKVYKAICHLYENNVRGIDAVTLANELMRLDQFDEIGGGEYLAEILEAVPHAAHVKYYSNIVREKWTRRSVIHAGRELVAGAYESDSTAEELLSTAQRALQSAEASHEGQTEDIQDLTRRCLLRAEDRMQRHLNGEVTMGISTGFASLDKHTAGLHPSELTILAARPAMGKTALAANVAVNVAKLDGPVMFFSLEQADIELCDRILCNLGSVNAGRLRDGTTTDAEHRQLFNAGATLAKLPILIDSVPTRTMSQIGAISRRFKRQEGTLSLICVDYLQLIRPEDKRAPREQQISDISRRLKVLAKELDCPVLALSQLNRELEKRPDKRPKLSDLRESGAIEQDADVVSFLYRPGVYNPDGDQTEAEWIISKCRAGQTGTLQITWKPEHMRFSDRVDPVYEGSL